ncbi:MAG: metallophosphoesterase [Pseudomonadota bacterium]|nr:metallophosphoesterase [Pseudomonadota bacterium]
MALRETEQRLSPHLIAVSGDLTQRARKHEFAAAREFLDSLAAPKIVVPGNHDIPLYNLIARFLTPLERFRQYMGDEVEPTFVDDEIAVVGINTARSLAFKEGRINREQVDRALEIFRGIARERIRILVTHHPFDLPDDPDGHEPVGRATMALAILRECMPDLLLAGHVHLHGIGTTAERYNLGGRSAIVVQAGTATSTRHRGATNSFNLIRIDRSDIAIERFDLSPTGNTFEIETTTRFTRGDGGWTEADGLAD